MKAKYKSTEYSVLSSNLYNTLRTQTIELMDYSNELMNKLEKQY